MKFLRRLNPLPGIRDFRQEFLRPHPYRYRIMLVSAALTFTIFSVLVREDYKGLPHPPHIVYISTLAPDRADDEIIASNLANQQRKEQLAAEQAERDAKVQEIYRTLARASGMDVEKIEHDAKIQREAEEKAAAQELDRLRGRSVEKNTQGDDASASATTNNARTHDSGAHDLGANNLDTGKADNSTPSTNEATSGPATQ